MPVNDGNTPPLARHRAVRVGRTFLILVPLHLVAFLALYLGLLALVRREVRISHGEAAAMLVRTLVDDLHPLMVASGPDEIRQALVRSTSNHDLLDLELFDANAAPLSDPATVNPTVAALIASRTEQEIELRRTDSGWTMQGTVAITAAAEHCHTCHQPNQVLGAAVLSYDITPYMDAATSRLRRSIGLLVVGWVGLVAIVAVASRGAVRRAVVRLRAEISSDGTAGPIPGVSKLMLDPVSAELYASLHEVLRSQRQREEQVASRLSHTDRLASLGQLAAGLAHEIKNPVAGLQGALEILRDETADPNHRELFEQMIGETRRVTETLQSLLHFARPARPQMDLTDVDALLRDLAQLTAPSLARRQARLEVETAPDLPRFVLDPGQIRQVLVNLVNNAADAMEGNGGRVVLRATTFPDGGGLILGVEDDGPGMSPEVASRIFEPFFTTKHHGTGLGLAVARSLVAQHGGRLEVRSNPGSGTTFLIVLPGVGYPEAASGVAAS